MALFTGTIRGWIMLESTMDSNKKNFLFQQKLTKCLRFQSPESMLVVGEILIESIIFLLDFNKDAVVFGH